MSKSWFIRADYTVYADTLDQAISLWMENVDMIAFQSSVVFDGIQEAYENEWKEDE
jgi:hypothetical protein